MAVIFEHVVRVRWRDTDALGHVNHAVFLTYLEEGRDAFYAQVLGSDPSYVVVRLEMDLRAEVRHLDQQVTVRILAERLGTTSLTTREIILTSSGEVAAEARIVTVRWDSSRRQPIPFSQTERTRLTAAMAGKPSRGEPPHGGGVAAASPTTRSAQKLPVDNLARPVPVHVAGLEVLEVTTEGSSCTVIRLRLRSRLHVSDPGVSAETLRNCGPAFPRERAASGRPAEQSATPR